MDFLNYEPLITLIISLIALILALIALYYTVKSFLLKSGHKIRCDIQTRSTIECSDNHISSITLENLKDRATVIFTIYLQLGRNNYLIIEDFEKKPLILKPFEVYYKEYSSLIFYSVSLKRVNLNNLLTNSKIYRKVILSTTDGKYIVKANTKKWSPISQFFNNYLTAIISPKRFSYDGVFYGENTKFLIELKDNNHKSVVAIYKNDYEIKKFKNFSLSKESLESSEKLKVYLMEQRANNKLSFDELNIVDFSEKVKNMLSEYNEKKINIEALSFFNYHILGKIYTIRQNRKTFQENKKNINKKKKKYKYHKIED